MTKASEWVAEYDDGTIVPQIAEDGTERSHKDLALDRVVAFTLYVNGKRFHLSLDGKKLIYRRRCFEQYPGAHLWHVYLLGWHAETSDGPVRSYMLIDEDGNAEMHSEWKDTAYHVQPDFDDVEL